MAHPSLSSLFRFWLHPKTAKHKQIHRDAFSYGEVAQTIDSRTIVDLRFFGIAKPRVENTITFETKYQDDFGMPQPTFNFLLSDEDGKRAQRMMLEYVLYLLY